MLLHYITAEWCVQDRVHNSRKFRSGLKFWFVVSLVQVYGTFTYNTCTLARQIKWGQFHTRFNSYLYHKLKLRFSFTNYSLVIKFVLVPLGYTHACKDSRDIPSINSNSGLDGDKWSISRPGRFYLQLVWHQKRSRRSRRREKNLPPAPDSNPGSFWPQLVAIPSAQKRLLLINNAVILCVVSIIVSCEKWQVLQIFTYIWKQFIRFQ